MNIKNFSWESEDQVRALFSWQTKVGIAPQFGSRPIGWYQQHQCAAFDILKGFSKQYGGTEFRLNSDKGGIQIRSGGKWLFCDSVNNIFNKADKISRGEQPTQPKEQKHFYVKINPVLDGSGHVRYTQVGAIDEGDAIKKLRREGFTGSFQFLSREDYLSHDDDLLPPYKELSPGEVSPGEATPIQYQKLSVEAEKYVKEIRETLFPSFGMALMNYERINDAIGTKVFTLAANYKTNRGHKVTFVYDSLSKEWELGAD